MIYITGDTHGDFQRLSKRQFPQQKSMTKNDIVIILGDFGGIWEPEETKEERYWLDWLDNKPYDTTFLDGNHENFDRLYHEYDVVDYHGGKAHKIRDHVYHLMRGEIFNFEGIYFWVMGGAETHDTEHILLRDNPRHFNEVARVLRKQNIFYRVYGESWFHQEMPSKEELAHGIESLEKADWMVDYVLSHCAPTSVFKPLNAVGMKPNGLTEYFDEIKKKLDYSKWFFGHYHMDMELGKFRVLYHDIVRIS